MSKKIKLASLLFALIFCVGTAFAATNGILIFGGTVRINNASVERAQLEFISTSIRCSFGVASSEIVVQNGVQNLTYETVIDFCPTFYWPAVLSQVDFRVQNTGTVPIRLEREQLGNFTHHVEVTLHGTVDGEQVLFYNLFVAPNSPVSAYVTDRLIQPGQILEGQILFNPLVVNGGIPSEFEQIIRRNSFNLFYTSAVR